MSGPPTDRAASQALSLALAGTAPRKEQRKFAMKLLFTFLLLASCCFAQSSGTQQFCNFQQNAFLNADMTNPAIFNYKQLGLGICQMLQNQDTLTWAQAQILTLNQEIANLQQQVGQFQTLSHVLAPTTLGVPISFAAALGSNLNVLFLTPMANGILPSTVSSCSLYAGAASNPTTGHFGCAIYTQDATPKLVCTTSADVPITAASAWSTNSNFSNCQLAANTKYWLGFNKGPYQAVAVTEDYLGAQVGAQVNLGVFPPYPQTLSTLQAGPRWSVYVTVKPQGQ